MRRRQLSVRQIILVLVTLFFITFLIATAAPANFPVDKQITIAEGATTSQIANLLAEQGVIKSALVFKILLKFGGGEKSVQAGDYWFEAPLATWRVVGRLGTGQFVLHPVKLTIIEGSNPSQISKAIIGKLPDLASSRTELNQLISAHIGEILPDTYFVQSQISAARLIETMRRNFQKQTSALRAATLVTGRPWTDVVIMASIVEEEASEPETRRIIAGILWKRLDDRMLLQVDVAPETYKKLGLPAQAIANPGLDALEAVVSARDSDYWYYLSDKKGVTHYAVDFAGHKENRVKYLAK